MLLLLVWSQYVYLYEWYLRINFDINSFFYINFVLSTYNGVKLLDKVFWSKHKDSGIPIEVNSFAVMLNFCLFYNKNSAIFISDRYHNKYFSPLKKTYNLTFTYEDKIKKVTVDVEVLLNKDYDMYLSLISYFKEILSKEDLGHLINFIEKLKFWKKSKSRFIKQLTIEENNIQIDFNILSSRIEKIIFL